MKYDVGDVARRAVLFVVEFVAEDNAQELLVGKLGLTSHDALSIEPAK